MNFKEVAKRAEIGPLMDATIHDDRRPPLKCLMPDDGGQIPARFSDQIASKFKHDPSRRGAINKLG